MNTDEQYSQAVAPCRDTFLHKTRDYGTSWRVYRPISVADQIYIKAKRIRTIQEKKYNGYPTELKVSLRAYSIMR